MQGNQSQLRQRINRLYTEVGTIIDGLLKGRKTLVRGSVYIRRRRCGKNNCRCNRGSLHEDMVYAVREGRHMNVHAIGKMEGMMIKEGLNRLRHYQRRRHAVAQGFTRILAGLDTLGKLRSEGYRKR